MTGKTGNKKEARRYRHHTERHCDSKIRSVNADLLERDFLFLLESLTVKPDALPMLAQALEHVNNQNQSEEQAHAIRAEITHWQQRAQNADTLFLKARISEDSWRETLEAAEYEIARLESQIAQQNEAEVALKLSMEMVANLVENWNQANNETRRALASSLFEYLIYDLDKQQIVDFKLKPWVELLMQLKVTMDAPNPTSDFDGKQGVLWCSRRGIDPSEYPTALLDPRTCAKELLDRIYKFISVPKPPIDKNLRDAEIYKRFRQGESTSKLAQVFGLTVQRIRAILRKMVK